MVNTEQACYLQGASVTIPGKNLQHLQVQVTLNMSRWTHAIGKMYENVLFPAQSLFSYSHDTEISSKVLQALQQ